MKVALILNDDFSMWRFRKGLILTLVRQGHQVCVITPSGPYVPRIQSLGAVHIAVPMSRFVAPFSDLKLFIDFYKVFRREKFDLVHNMTIKPVIYGSIAARFVKVPKIAGLISGIGFVFLEGNSFKMKVIRPFVMRMLEVGFRSCDKVWFQNPEDLNYFVEKKLLPKEKTVLIKGSGIDPEEFSLDNLNSKYLESLKKEFGIEKDGKVVSMVVARLIWSKGVREFLESARLLTNKYPKSKFILVAPLDQGSPDSVPPEYIQNFVSKNISIITEFREDANEILAISDIFVLPSYFREGLPRVLLEAMSLRKPIVTTDSVGCREAVENGKNGYLVPVKNTKMLTEAIECLLTNDSLRKEFGEYSRIKAKREFDEKMVVQKIIAELY